MIPTPEPEAAQPAPSTANNADANPAQVRKPNSRARRGNVASLPRNVRDSINRMMDDGLNSRAILEKLGPESTL